MTEHDKIMHGDPAVPKPQGVIDVSGSSDWKASREALNGSPLHWAVMERLCERMRMQFEEKLLGGEKAVVES